MSQYKIEAGTGQHIGDRSEQQDRTALFVAPKAPGYMMAVLADGMGGLSGGSLAAEQVIRTGIPYAFPPTNSRERRQLHMAFKEIAGVETASSGEGQDRFLAVYPAGKTNLPVTPPVKPRGFERRR